MTAMPMTAAGGPAPVIFGGCKGIDDQAGTGTATGRRDRYLVPVLGLCLLVATTAYLMVFTLLGQIGASLHAPQTTLTWLTIAAVITGTVSSVLLPALGSVLGQRRLMAGTLGCLAAVTIPAGRARVIDVGQGGDMAGPSAAVPDARVPGLAVPATRRHIDIRGALLLTLGLAAALLPVTQGKAWGWTSPRVTTLLAAAAVLLTAWAVTAVRSAEPLVRLRILARPGVAAGVVLFMLTAATVGVVNLTVPSFLEAPRAAGHGTGASVLGAGLDMLPFAAAITIAGYFAGGWRSGCARRPSRSPPSAPRPSRSACWRASTTARARSSRSSRSSAPVTERWWRPSSSRSRARSARPTRARPPGSAARRAESAVPSPARRSPPCSRAD